MNSCHQTCLDTEVIVQYLSDRSQAVCCTRSVRNDLLTVVLVSVNTANEHISLVTVSVSLRRSRKYYILSTSLQVLLSLVVSEEETCRLNYVLSTNLIPLQVLRITLSSNTDVVTVYDQLVLLNVSLDSTVELTVHCIILQHVSHVINWAQVIDSYYLYFLCVLSLNCRTEYETTDTAKSVNTNLNHCSNI